MSLFQIILTVVFVIAIVFAILLIGGYIPGFGGSATVIRSVPITVWGTFPSSAIVSVLNEMNGLQNAPYNISYVQKPAETFNEDLLNALASGVGPDIWLISQETLFENKDRLAVAPFSVFSERAYLDSFADEAELFLKKEPNDNSSKKDEGIYAFPVAIDPLVLYWNKDLLASSGISKPPATWNDFLLNSEQLTIKDARGNVTLSGAALGEARNIGHAKEILSTLMFQAGSSIVNPADYSITLNDSSSDGGLSPAGKAVEFYTDFSNPSKMAYSWNRSLPDSASFFAQGSLAFYFGFASEYDAIKTRNPHLNFDIAPVPQTLGAETKTVFGRLYGFGVSKLSKNQSPAVSAVGNLASAGNAKKLSDNLRLPPVRRDLLAEGNANPVLSAAYKSAIMARGWIEPPGNQAGVIFQNLVESVSTGRARFSEASQIARDELNKAFGK